MSTISVQADIPSAYLLEALERLPPAEFDHLFEKIARLRGQRKVSSLSQQEGSLLQIINDGLTDSEWSRLKALIAKRKAETLVPAEMNELRQLTERLEHLQVRRARALVELAQLRGVSLNSLMTDLSIQPHGDE